MPTKQIVQTPELLKILQDAGIDLSASNLSRFISTYNLTKAPSLMKQDYDTRVGKDGKTYRYARPPRKVTTGIYFKPTAAELKDLKNQYDKNILKKTDMGPGKVAFDKRNKRAIELLKSGKYSLAEAERILLKEFPEVKGMKSTLQNLKKNIKGIPSGTTGPTATVVKRVTSALNKLNKSNVKNLIESGEKNLDKLIKASKKVLGVSENLAARRLGQLMEAYQGSNEYVNLTDKFLARQSGNIIKGLTVGKYGGIGGGLIRKLHEKKVGKELGENKNFFSSLKKRIQERIKSGDYETDVVKNLASSSRNASSPYSIFLQGIRSDINQEKGKRLDRILGIAESKIQATSNLSEKKKIAEAYNTEAKAFAKDANKNLKKGQLPVRVMEISFDSPSKTIKNKEAYELFDDVFEKIYDKHGYSFKVPKDLKTVYDVKPFVQSGKGQIQINKAIAQNAGRLFSITPILALPALAGYGTYKALEKGVEDLRFASTGDTPLEVDNTGAVIGGGVAAAVAGGAALKYNKEIGAFVTGNDNIASQADIKLYAEENPIPVEVDTKPPVEDKSVTKGVFKTLAKVGAPLPTALIDSYFIGQQVKEGKSPGEIASDPLNWIGLAAMEPLAKVSGIAESGKLNKALRLGLNPATIRGISRFAGLPGLAVSTAMTAYDQYKKYQNQEGFVYDLFNKEGK
jgi:hypothetical protein